MWPPAHAARLFRIGGAQLALSRGQSTPGTVQRGSASCRVGGDAPPKRALGVESAARGPEAANVERCGDREAADRA
eukprot:8688964-Pyramimonas_sp.AAC.1